MALSFFSPVQTAFHANARIEDLERGGVRRRRRRRMRRRRKGEEEDEEKEEEMRVGVIQMNMMALRP